LFVMGKRMPSGKSVEKDVVTASRRRCCLCVFLLGQDNVCNGQIVHLNRDPSDSRFENLVFLCLEHHDQYDTRRSQSKGFLPLEVQEYRDRLYARYPAATKTPSEPFAVELEPLAETSQYERLRKRFDRELHVTSAPWRYPLWQVANEPEFFAYKSGNRCDGVCLVERIDLPDGRIVIACIETAGNPGNSITNNVEMLCFQVCERFDIPAERLVWLEHYDYDEDAEWSMVTFQRRPPEHPFEDPRWTTMNPEIWRGLKLKPRKPLEKWRGHFRSKLRSFFRGQQQPFSKVARFAVLYEHRPISLQRTFQALPRLGTPC